MYQAAAPQRIGGAIPNGADWLWRPAGGAKKQRSPVDDAHICRILV